MTQKQILSVLIGVIGLGVLSLFVYGQFVKPISTGFELSDVVSTKDGQSSPSKSEGVATAKEVVIPDTIDDISASIESEADADLSALDAEESGAISDIEADSQSVNNLGTSYDENNL